VHKRRARFAAALLPALALSAAAAVSNLRISADCAWQTSAGAAAKQCCRRQRQRSSGNNHSFCGIMPACYQDGQNIVKNSWAISSQLASAKKRRAAAMTAGKNGDITSGISIIDIIAGKSIDIISQMWTA